MSSTNNSAVLSSVIASLVSSYDVTDPAPIVKARKATAPRAKLARVERSEGGSATVRKIVASPIAVPPVGSLDAAGFLLAMRDAGKIRKENDRGVMVSLTDAAKEKADQIQAIAGFVGYDFGAPHGVQLDKARNAAQSKLRPVSTDSKVAVTVKAFVAGMPNGTERAVKDLQGRIRMADETRIEHECKAEKLPVDSAEHATHMALAAIECERIAHMKRDLALIVGE